ncbi:MAG: MoxR family ATPase [Candidatus Schekmanbacteria bacterium]|nr:MAG: MoxR family ATPase [Candidatus Schekmanbacteria bacterium]
MDIDVSEINKAVEDKQGIVSAIKEEIGNAVIGQKYMVDRTLIALLCEGHILIEGVPGLAKTTMVKVFAQCLDFTFQRIQFTPDLLPADLIGTQIYHQKDGNFTVRKGPIFTNILLADEINRAPAKVQSALLEAMQENQVTIGDESFKLENPFIVLATQNPIEQEGTYPLPEAQVDRFIMKLKISYPSQEEEKRIVKEIGKIRTYVPKKVAGHNEIEELKKLVEKVYVDEKIYDYILNIVFATRNPASFGINVKDFIMYGASPRASIYLMSCARANAFLEGRGYVVPDDVKAVCFDVLRHRIILSYEAEAEEITSDDIIERILKQIPVP